MPCSCGKCLGGVLSPRMAARLRLTAEACTELISDSLPEHWSGEC